MTNKPKDGSHPALFSKGAISKSFVDNISEISEEILSLQIKYIERELEISDAKKCDMGKVHGSFANIWLDTNSMESIESKYHL